MHNNNSASKATFADKLQVQLVHANLLIHVLWISSHLFQHDSDLREARVEPAEHEKAETPGLYTAAID